MADLRYLLLSTFGDFGNTSLGTPVTLDASTEKAAVVFQAQENATITDLYVRIAVITGTTPTHRLSLQGVDASGNPDGTMLGGGSPASVTFNPSGLGWANTTGHWLTLANAIAITRGTWYAWVLDYSSGTINASNFATWQTRMAGSTHNGYCVTDTTGSWVKTVTSLPVFGFKSSTQVYGSPVVAAFNTSDAVSGHRRACRILLDGAFGDTYQLAGIQFVGRINATGTTFKLGIWRASDGAELEAISIDADNVSSTATNTTYCYLFDTLVSLSYGTAYYVGIEAGGGTTFSLNGLTISDSNDLTAFPGGPEFYLATYNGTTWSEDQTTRLACNLILATTTAAAGGTISVSSHCPSIVIAKDVVGY